MKEQRTWCENPCGKKSFAILINDYNSFVASTAEDHAMSFFTRVACNTEEQRRMLDVVQSTGMKEIGFGVTTAKHTFNIKRGSSYPPDCWPSTSHSSSDDGCAFPVATLACFDFLESVCSRAYGVLQGVSHEEGMRILNSHGALGTPPDGLSASILQCFYYFNTPALEDHPNCGEHVDQGFLSIAPATATPGLEVFAFDTEEWIQNDKLVERADLMLFASEMLQWHSDQCRGTIHRVGKAAEPRLSMVHELRHRAIEELEDSNSIYVHYNDRNI